MAKGKPKAATAEAAAAAEPPITIAYDLFDLPTAQHKAGLAGLLLQLRSMQNRKRPAPAYAWDKDQPATRVHVTFTRDTVQGLFNDLYAAEVVEEEFPSKKDKEHLKGERFREVRGKRTRFFVYDVVRPTLPTLRHYLGESEAGSRCLKLWQGMLWAVPRGVNTTRIPFEVVAGWDRKQPKDQRRVAASRCPEGAAAWRVLERIGTAPPDTPPGLAELDGKLWLGAQKSTAERVDFEGRTDHNLLLHFWPLATLVYVPQGLKVGRRQGKYEAKRKADGYALAVPDVADLPEFCDRFVQVLQALGSEDPKGKGRPRSALVELPAQGALSFLGRDRAGAIARQKATSGETEFSIHGVDYLHFRPGKNGPRMLSAGRLSVRPHLAEAYTDIVGRPGEKPPYGNPLFRRGLVQALLDGQPWFRPFGRMFHEWPAEFFVDSEKSPEKLSWFWADARKKFHILEDEMKGADSPNPDDALGVVVLRIVRRYLDEHVLAKTGEDPRPYRKAKKPQRPDMLEERRRVAQGLFLQLRSRREHDFTTLFRDKLMPCGQWLKDSDVLLLHHALADRTEAVKTLTLFALSANSYVPMKKENAQ